MCCLEANHGVSIMFMASHHHTVCVAGCPSVSGLSLWLASTSADSLANGSDDLGVPH